MLFRAVALLAFLTMALGACASGETPAPADPTVEVVAAESAPEARAPVPEIVADEDPALMPSPSNSPVEVAAAPEAAVPGGYTLTVVNATGMTITAFHMVACGESEGNDWSMMREWTYNYIEAPLAPGAEAAIETSAECLVTLPVWEDGTEIQEKVLLTSDLRHSVTLG